MTQSKPEQMRCLDGLHGVLPFAGAWQDSGSSQSRGEKEQACEHAEGESQASLPTELDQGGLSN